MTQVPPIQTSPPVEPYYEQRPSATLGVLALVFGIVALIPFVGSALAIPAIVMGVITLATDRAGKRMAAAGIVLAVLGVVITVGAMVALVLPSVARARQMARQTACMANLRGIGSAMALYEHDNNFRTPSMYIGGDGRGDDYSGAPQSVGTIGQLWSADPAKGAQQGVVAQNWWLLVQGGYALEDHFRCPSDQGYIARRPGDAPVGFARREMVSYGLQPCTKADSGRWRMVAYVGAPGQSGEVPIAGDRPTAALRPGATNRLEDFSANHYGDGCNMLRRGVSVSWNSVRHNNVGKFGNNLYRTDLDADGNVMTTGSPDGVTVHPCDSYLFWQTRYEDADSGK